MKVVLVLVVGTAVLFAALASLELLRAAASRLLGRGRRAGRQGRGRSSPDVWGNVREARCDAEALRSRPDLGSAWTSWERRERQGP
jgi:hypothetical protein